MRILTFSTLFPNSCQARHGIFVAERLRHLVGTGKVEARIVAPVPWFPSARAVFGSYGVYARVPAAEMRDGMQVLHPRYLVVPRIGMSLTPGALALAGWRAARTLRADGYDFDLIDAHYFYPDGVAAALMGKWLAKPVVITGRGSDVNVLPDYALPRRMIRWAARRSAGIVTVSVALATTLQGLGVPRAHIDVLQNGVDLDVFKPLDRAQARSRLAVTAPMLLSIGNLLPNKGHHLVIEALRELHDAQLVIVGDGPARAGLARLAADLGLESRVRFVDPVPQHTLVSYYNAADVVVLASEREGMPNVLLEAMACGTAVVATPVGGIPEIVNASAAGLLVKERSPAALASAAARLLANPPDRRATRRHASRFGWAATSHGQLEIFRRILAKSG